MNKVLSDIASEMGRQERLFGDDQGHSLLEWSAIVSEEAVEVAKAALHLSRGIEEDSDIRMELVQVAASAATAISHIDRHGATAIARPYRRRA